MLCKKCNSTVPAGKFCSVCGARLEAQPQIPGMNPAFGVPGDLDGRSTAKTPAQPVWTASPSLRPSPAPGFDTNRTVVLDQPPVIPGGYDPNQTVVLDQPPVIPGGYDPNQTVVLDQPPVIPGGYDPNQTVVLDQPPVIPGGYDPNQTVVLDQPPVIPGGYDPNQTVVLSEEPAPRAWNPPAPPVQNNAYNGPRCPRCGNAMEPGTQFCMACGWSAEPKPVPRAERWTTPTGEPQRRPAPARKPKSSGGKHASKSILANPKAKIGIIAGGAVVALLLIVLIVGFATNWFGLSGPAMEIYSAAEKTLSAGNFTVEFRGDEDGDVFKGIAYVDMDLDKEELSVLIEMRVDGEYGEIAIYDGYAVVHSEDYWDYAYIGDVLEEFFATYKESGSAELDWKEILDSVEYGLYDDVAEVIDFDKLEGCLKDYVMHLNDEKWLAENAGYTTREAQGVTYHEFNPDIAVFVNESATFLEDAFRNPEDYEDMMNLLEDVDDFMPRDLYMQLSVGIQGGKMVELKYYMGVAGEEVGLQFQFSDIGKTKLDEAYLEDMLDSAFRYG